MFSNRQLKEMWLRFKLADSVFWKEQLIKVKLYDEWLSVMEELKQLIYLTRRGMFSNKEFPEMDLPYYSVELDDFLLNVELINHIELYS